LHRDLRADLSILIAAIDERAELYSLLLLTDVMDVRPHEREINRLFRRLERLEKDIKDADHNS
jgi:hypothetical protein